VGEGSTNGLCAYLSDNEEKTSLRKDIYLCPIGRTSLVLIGVEVLIVGLAAWAAVTLLDVNILRGTDAQYQRSFLINIFLSQVATLPYIIAGIFVLVRGTGGLYWLVPAILFSFIKAILDAWVLLVEINR
jgi:hypothetical protein